MARASDTPRAVVTDDSHFMRSVISDILEDGGIEVVAQAKNGQEAVDAVLEHDPDVVTMDLEMPEVDGLEAVDRIMSEHPTPVLMLSAHTDENADVTFQALEKGAVDFFTKPGGEVSMEMSRLKDQIVDMVYSVAQADVSEQTTGSTAAPSTPTTEPGREFVDEPTLLIGSSTGGPTMVEQVLSELPLAADLRILIVQHMPGGFTDRFAQRIDNKSEYDVREAEDGDSITGGEALVAQGGYHMEVSSYRRGRVRVDLTEDPPVNSVRPAVDVTMKTAAATIDGPMTGLILTGMGEDGADGIAALKRAGAHTIAQDESTSAVYGMPKRAVETGAIDEVYPIDDIANAILEAFRAEVN